ncbi:MAG: DUF2330 domain-containing protein, partial [Bacteroidia bacterium]
YDANPCGSRGFEKKAEMATGTTKGGTTVPRTAAAKPAVVIEAQYQVGEYDILILSASESSGLETWLVKNGYNIPAGAREVLTPYVKSNMKFFVVKVNLQEQANSGFEYLRPLQIRFHSPKFMLPIRLGMANAKSYQDLIVYAFSKTGKVECTNYNTVKMPTGDEIPLFTKNIFGNFYKSVFDKSYLDAGRKSAFLEYSWNVSMSNPVKCDPCTGPPPMNQDLIAAGVTWSDYVHFTRLHFRYDRAHFAQDLVFQETPDKSTYQVRFVMNHPTNDISCLSQNEQTEYQMKVQKRSEKELANLYRLTGWSKNPEWGNYAQNSNLQVNTVPENVSRNINQRVKMPPTRNNDSLKGVIEKLKDSLGLQKSNPNQNTDNQIDSSVMKVGSVENSDSLTTTNGVNEPTIAPKETESSGDFWLKVLAGAGIFLVGASALVFAILKGMGKTPKI